MSAADRIAILWYRDEFRHEPRLLAAYLDRSRAERVRDFLAARYDQLLRSSVDPVQAESEWQAWQTRNRIPKARRFSIDIERYTNYAFEVIEVEIQ